MGLILTTEWELEPGVSMVSWRVKSRVIKSNHGWEVRHGSDKKTGFYPIDTDSIDGSK